MVSAPQQAALQQNSAPYLAPFLTFVGFMAVEKALNLPPEIGYPLRCLFTLAAIFWVSRGVISLRASQPVWSAILGAGVFAVWVAPDVLFGYRGHWLFENSVTGEVKSSLDHALRSNGLFLTLRVAGSVLIVPVLEELFWRAWLLRWLAARDFWRLPLGAYSTSAFWIVALLFASEHGPFWEVGLVAGVAYNWWMVRTKSLADCILAHAVTNGLLAIYVVAGGHWEYWL